MVSPQKKWREEGKNPDYRFSLANERTFLAWIRTALAFLAAAVGIVQFAPEFATLFQRDGLAILLAIVASTLAIVSYFRWANNERAMRNDKALPYTNLLKFIAVMMSVIALILLLLLSIHTLK